MSNHDRAAPSAHSQSQSQSQPAIARPARAAVGMKKFSKLFSRLGRGRATDPNGTSDWDTASTRESSPDVHQLTSKRRRGRDGALKRPARNGLSRIVADEKNPPCLACAAINFPRLLNWAPGQPRPWIPLAHTLSGDSECPYCIFFQALVGGLPDQTRKFTPYLRIRQAFERLGVGEKHELGSAVLFEVSTKTKALPWGYIVKAIEGEDDVAGYREAKPMLRGRVVSPKLDPVLPWTWIDFCMANHTFTACGTRGFAIRGLKLIDCREEEIVFLDDLNAEAVEYVTLSYAGGKSEDVADHHQPVELPEVLPPLIADAMAVTKSLGFRYLWVDRYCFPQFNATERRRQLGLMGDIFSRSALTLIVAAGEGVQDGIPGISVPREEQLTLQTDAGFFTTSLTRPDFEVSNSKWATRGWTYQEGLFSRRRLVFTPSQVYFQCRSLHCHESICYPLKTKPTLNLGRVFPLNNGGTHAGEFRAQVNNYLPREFSSLEDRLDAFRSVLSHYEQMDPPVENLLGLPLYHPMDFRNVSKPTRTDQLAVGLGWKLDIPNDDPARVYPMYRDESFPSWTWLSWKLRPGQDEHDPRFHFFEVGDESPLVDGVTAAPGLEFSVGLKDDEVLPWETDGDVIGAKPDPVTFLRIKTHCFDIHLLRDQEGTTTLVTPDLRDPYRNTISSCLLRASTDMEAEPPVGDHDLIGVIISGRDIKGTSDFSFEGVNVLICGRKNWEIGSKFVRLGAVEFWGGGGVGGGLMRGVLNEDKHMNVSVREVDIY